MTDTIRPRRTPSGTRLRDLPDVLQPKHLSAVLGCSRGTIYELMRSGTLPAVAITPHRYVVAKSAFVAWLEKK
jgi:excisionase family DNA binding protein